MWFTNEPIAAWQAAPRTTRARQAWYAPVAILIALTLRSVFHLALRQTESLIGSIIRVLALTLTVPDHSAFSRRAETLEVPQPRSGTRMGAAPVYLLVDGAGLELGRAAGWLLEKHGTQTRRSWRKLHIGMDANTDELVAAALTASDGDDASQVGALLDQAEGSIASSIGVGAYDQDSVCRAVMGHDPEAAVIVPPRATAVPSETAKTAAIQRDRHLQGIGDKGRIGRQKLSSYTERSRVEATIERYNQGTNDSLRFYKDGHRATEVGVAVHGLNRLLELGRPVSVRFA